MLTSLPSLRKRCFDVSRTSDRNSFSTSFNIVRERGLPKWATYGRRLIPNRSPDDISVRFEGGGYLGDD